MMIPARRNGNGLDIFDEVFADPFFGEKENKIMKTDLKEKDGKYMLEIDVPGYDRIDLHPATRFIATMNYGYSGTKELNEALVSRFLVIDMPAVDEEKLKMILKREFPTVDEEKLLQFIGIFMDLQLKAENGEISTKAIDLRGMIGALKTIKRGLKPTLAINMGITGKTFDIYEKKWYQIL